MEIKNEGMDSAKELETQKKRMKAEVLDEKIENQKISYEGASKVGEIRKEQVEYNEILKQAEKNLAYYESLEKQGLLEDVSKIDSAKNTLAIINERISTGNKDTEQLMGIEGISNIVHDEALGINSRMEKDKAMEEKKALLIERANAWAIKFKRAVDHAADIDNKRKKLLQEYRLSEENLEKISKEIISAYNLSDVISFRGGVIGYREYLESQRKKLKFFDITKKSGFDKLMKSEELKMWQESSARVNNPEFKKMEIWEVLQSDKELMSEFAEIKYECGNCYKHGEDGFSEIKKTMSEFLDSKRSNPYKDHSFSYSGWLKEVEKYTF